MPYPKEYAARILPPGRFESIRSRDAGNGIRLLVGVLNGKTLVQAVRFDKDKWTVARAKKWLTSNKYKYIEFA